MAESYFDPNSAYDLRLLRGDVRGEDASERDRIAREAEADAIEWYTERVGSTGTPTAGYRTRRIHADAEKVGAGVYVFLDGYAEDAAEADGYVANRKDWTGFARTFRQAIARVISHRLRYLDEDPTLSLQSQGSRSKARGSGALNPRWPKRWHRGLGRYDVREGGYHI